MEELLRCPVCLDLAKDPRETVCCNQLFCLECIQPLQRCPVCRTERFTYQINKMVTRMLDSLPDVCPFECGASITRGNLKDHIATCEQRLFACGVSTCDQVTHTGKAQYLQHMVDQHADLVEEAISQYFERRERTDIAQSDSGVNLIRLGDLEFSMTPVQQQPYRQRTLGWSLPPPPLQGIYGHLPPPPPPPPPPLPPSYYNATTQIAPQPPLSLPGINGSRGSRGSRPTEAVPNRWFSGL